MADLDTAFLFHHIQQAPCLIEADAFSVHTSDGHTVGFLIPGH